MNKVYPCSFKIVNKKPIGTPVTSFGVVHMKLLKRYLNKYELKERSLIINGLLSYSIFLIRSNLIKSFNLQKHQKTELREKLLPLGNRYYSRCITLLRVLITRPNFDFEVSLVISELLNRVSLLEFRTLKNCLVFNNGVISIIQNLVTNVHFKSVKSYPSDLQTVLKYLMFAGKSVYFPSYNHHVLYEISKNLNQFQIDFLHRLKLPENTLINFQLNHLIQYVNMLIQQFEMNQDFSFEVLFNILRSWIINLPAKLSIIDSPGNPLDHVILGFYRTMCTVLNSLFPQINGMFLISFTGNLQVFNPPDYGVKFSFDLWFSDYSTNYSTQELSVMKEQWIYFTRLHTFFTKRHNVLSIFFNYLNFASLLNTVGDTTKMTLSHVQSRCNEIPIHTFGDTLIQNYHYPHIGNQIEFCQIKENSSISFEQLEQMPNPYDRNGFHWDMIKEKYRSKFFPKCTPIQRHEPQHQGEGAQTSVKCKPDATSEGVDPIFDYLKGNFVKVNKPIEVDLRYEIFNNFIDVIGYGSSMNKDYFDFLNSNIRCPDNLQINEATALDYRDKDPLDYIAPSFNFVSHIHNSFERFHVNEVFNNVRYMNSHLQEEHASEDDLVIKFYDDLNEMYFR